MARYVCNPIEVDAFQIVEVLKCNIERCPDWKREVIVKLENGDVYDCDPSKTSRMIPQIGDYLVRTHNPDEYEYLNPKHVFEAKYTRISESPLP